MNAVRVRDGTEDRKCSAGLSYLRKDSHNEWGFMCGWSSDGAGLRDAGVGWIARFDSTKEK